MRYIAHCTCVKQASRRCDNHDRHCRSSDSHSALAHLFFEVPGCDGIAYSLWDLQIVPQRRRLGLLAGILIHIVTRGARMRFDGQARLGRGSRLAAAAVGPCWATECVLLRRWGGMLSGAAAANLAELQVALIAFRDACRAADQRRNGQDGRAEATGCRAAAGWRLACIRCLHWACTAQLGACPGATRGVCLRRKYQMLCLSRKCAVRQINTMEASELKLQASPGASCFELKQTCSRC